MDMSAVLTQMAILVIIMMVGFVCAKLKITGPAFNKAASPVVMNVLLVATILGSVMGTELTLSVGEVFRLIGYMFLLVIISGALGAVTPKIFGIKGDDAGLTAVMITFMNSVFVAFPVIQSIYGQEGIFYASMSNIPFNLVLFSYGVARVRGGTGDGMRGLLKMFSPPLIATLIAIVIFMAEIPIPNFIAKTCTSMGSATIPMSMLVVGTSLGGIKTKEVFIDWRVYIISFVKLIICPVVMWLIMGLFITDPMTLNIIVIIASAPVAMVVTVLTIQYDKNEVLSSKGVFISTILSAVTMPLVIWLLLM
ncbi:MAG: AEC family transporter [Clostridia bacterium]|nr:AEC family transporter [Clostridia bacterium]